MQKYMEYKCTSSAGFSLVEIMVMLVAVSCVVTAFAPLITKKCQAQVRQLAHQVAEELVD